MMLGATKDAAYLAVGAASAQFTTMVEGSRYVVMSTTAAWIAIGSNPTAVIRAAGNTYLPPNIPVIVTAETGALKVAIIQDTAAGHSSLTRVQ